MLLRAARHAVVLLSLLATPVLAATSPPGMNIRWDACFADGGTMNKTFACATNGGSERLVLSFVLDAPMSNVTGQEITVDVSSASPTLPAWWLYRNAGSCRSTSLSLSTTLPPGAVNCLDWANGQASGGIGAYVLGGNTGDPDVARILAAVAVPASGISTLAAGQEYFNASLVINHAKTVGTGACAGCDVPVCILYQRCKLTTPSIETDRIFTEGANWLGSQIAYWQNGYATNTNLDCTRGSQATGCYRYFSCVPYSVTRSRGSSWGAVKSLYH